MILDTNAVSALLGGDQDLVQVLVSVSRYHIPLPVIGEYRFGLLAMGFRKRYESLFRRLEAESEVLLPNRVTADWYATIRHDMKQRGQPIPEGDLWIAALARQHELEIVSQDQHFDQVYKVRRIGW